MYISLIFIWSLLKFLCSNFNVPRFQLSMHSAEAKATAIWKIKTHQLSYNKTQIVEEYDYGIRLHVSYHIAWLGE